MTQPIHLRLQTESSSMKILCAAVAAFVVYTSPSAMAQGSIVNFFAIGPETGEPAYAGFLANMITNMRGFPSLATPFIPMGSTIDARNIVSYDNKTGQKLFSGSKTIDATPFTVGQISASLSSSFFNSSNLLTSVKFGTAVVGVKWGPDGPGTADTVYTSGDAGSTLLNELYIVSNTYTIRATDPSDKERAVESFGRLYGTLVTINSTYTKGPLMGYGSVNLSVPEPSTFALAGIGALALILSRKR